VCVFGSDEDVRRPVSRNRKMNAFDCDNATGHGPGGPDGGNDMRHDRILDWDSRASYSSEPVERNGAKGPRE
jgi:hypothetical protein